MRDRELLTALCAAIGFGPSGAAAQWLQRPEFPWERFVTLASRFKLTPVMHWRLTERRLTAGIPAEVLAYFESAAWLARERNRQELRQVARLARSLNRCGVRPVLLKGAASLVAGTYPEAAGRFLSDIDLLVPSGAIEDCAAVLATEGYGARPAAIRSYQRGRWTRAPITTRASSIPASPPVSSCTRP